MGAAIAGTLLRRGLGVRAWNRTRAKAEPLAEQGAIVADSPAAAAAGADVVLTVLYDAGAVLSAMTDKDGAIAVQGSATPNRAPPGRWPEVGYRMLAEQG